MKTPAEHLEIAEELLLAADGMSAGTEMGEHVLSSIAAIATAHVTLALAINAIPLLGDLGDEVRELRGSPRGLEV